MTPASNTPSRLHAARDSAMGWLVRYSFSNAEDTRQAHEVVKYVDRLRDEINWLREIHKADVAELQAELFAARQAAFKEGLRAEDLRPPSASPPVEAVSPAGGRKIDERLWEHECGCIEAANPYRRYPCGDHRKTTGEPNVAFFLAALLLMHAALACGITLGWVIWA